MIKIVNSRQLLLDGKIQGPVVAFLLKNPRYAEEVQAALDARESTMAGALDQHRAVAEQQKAEAVAAVQSRAAEEKRQALGVQNERRAIEMPPPVIVPATAEELSVPAK